MHSSRSWVRSDSPLSWVDPSSAVSSALSSSSSELSTLSSVSSVPAAAVGSGILSSLKPSTRSSMLISLLATRPDSSRIVAIVEGQAEMAWTILFRPSSIRLASSTSCLRVSSVAELISRIYMRTGSVVRPNSESTVASATSASSSA
ncbi:hypothetical protein D3C72_1566760 [compost metagenome]